MNNKFSKLLSLVLVVVMIASFIQLPALAAPQFKYSFENVLKYQGTGNNMYQAPIDNHPYHLAFTAHDSENPGAQYSYSVTASDNTYVSMDSNGVFTISPEFNQAAAQTADGFIGVGVSSFTVTDEQGSSAVTSPITGIDRIYKSYDYDFEDGISADFSRGSIAPPEANGNTYLAVGSGNRIITPSIRFRHFGNSLKWCDNPVIVVEFDGKNMYSSSVSAYSGFCPIRWDGNKILNDPNEIGDGAIFYGTDNANTYYEIPADEWSGWVNYKLIFSLITPTGATRPYYDLYVNDVLVIKNGRFNPTATSTGSNCGIDLYSYYGIDNFKQYTSTLGFAYNVSSYFGVSGDSRTLSINASHARMPISNVPEELEYAFYECDSDGVVASDATPLLVSSQPSYPINESEDTGKRIKVAARVKEVDIHDCASEWVFENGYTTIEEPVTESLLVGTKGTSECNTRFKLPTTVNDANKVWSVFRDSDDDGVSITPDGVIEIEEYPSASVVLMAFDKVTYEMKNYELTYDTASTSSEIPLSNALSPVMFKADVSTTSSATISAGSYDFEVTSDAEGFKFIVEDEVYYLLIDDVLIDSGDFNEDIRDISITGGEFTSYYAGSPLKTAGLFTSATIADAYEFCEIATPDTPFYNESGIYPEPETFSYEWYLDGELISTDASFVLPSDSEGKELYCDVTCVTDTDVTVKTNTLTVGAQYILTVNSAGRADFTLRSLDTSVYVAFVGSDKVDFYDMDDDSDITVFLTPENTYNVFILKKDTLQPRGLGSTVVPSEESVTPISLPEGASPVVNFIVKNTGLDLNYAVPCHFETPVTYNELISYLSDNCGIVDKSKFISDIFIDSESVSSYNFEGQSQGLYRIISVPAEGTVVENVTEYNELYKLFNNVSNYSYPSFKSITTKALNLKFVCLACGEFFASANTVCPDCRAKNSIVEEYDMIMDYANGVANRPNLNSLMATEGKHFPASATLESLSELSAKSDGMLSFLEIQLEKADLPTNAVKLMRFTTQYADAMAHLNRSSGLETALSGLTNYLILAEVQNGSNTTNIADALKFAGSSIFNNSNEDIQKWVAGQVKGKTYGTVPALKAAVDAYVNSYVPEDEDDEPSGESKGSVSISGSPYTPPVVVQPVSRFNDMAISHWAYIYVERMNNAGVLSGYNGNFRPEDNITRAEFAKVLATAFELDASSDATYADVSADAWYAQYVNTLTALGIVKGDNGNFRPNDTISRQDAAVMIHRLFTHLEIATEEGELSFTDTDDISEYAASAISALVKAGIVNGMNDGSFAPSNSITRAQVAKLICASVDFGGDK